MNNTAKIFFVLLVLAMVFSFYQTLRLKKVSVSGDTLKYQFMNTEKKQDKVSKDLQEAYKTIGILKQENERLSNLVSENRLGADKQKAEDLKKRTEAILGIEP